MKDKIKLKWKIFLYLIIGYAILLMLYLGIQATITGKIYDKIQEIDRENAIVLIQENIDSEDLPKIIDYLVREKNIMINPVKSNDEKTGMLKNDNQLVVFEKSDGTTVEFNILTSLRHTRSKYMPSISQLVIIILFMIGFSVVLSSFIAKRISSPIVDINEKAKKIAEGDYTSHFDENSFLEISELSKTLNYTNKELSKVEKLRRELMSNISHDLRTPLSLIYSYAEMMNDFPQTVSKEQTQVIMDETKRLSSLVDDVLNLSQLETGTMTLNYSNYDITQDIISLVDTMNDLLIKDNYSIEFLYDEHINVNADKIKIYQAIYNLVVNAINYTGDDKKVTIKQIQQDGFVTVEIIDSGEGIKDDELEYIWDRYYKAQTNHRRPVTGTGIGLSVVKNIMMLHSGDYGVTSHSGKGSIFYIKLKI